MATITKILKRNYSGQINPRKITRKLHGWWSADSVIKDGSDNVSQLFDLSGNGRHATQSTGANQPNFIADGGANFNNLPVIRFNGTTNFLEVADFDYVDYTKINVWIILSNDGTGGIISPLGHSDTNMQRSWSFARTIGKKIFYRLSGDGITLDKNIAGAAVLTDNQAYLVSMQYSIDTLSVFLDGLDNFGSFITNNTISSAHDSTAKLTIGTLLASGLPINLWAGDIAEIILSGIITANEGALIDKYLLLKYGI